VLKASNIISVPVGAGMYQVASYDTRDYYDEKDRPSFTDFSSNNVVYYIRNPYFYTTSGQPNNTPETSKISNCKIKFIRYKVITTARLLDSVLTGEVDFGDPSATQSNMDKLQAAKDISVKDIEKLVPTAVRKEGLSIKGSQVQDAMEDIKAWVETL